MIAYGAPSSIGRRAPIVRPASRAGISSAEARLVSTGSILLFGLRSVKVSPQVLSTCHQMHSVVTTSRCTVTATTACTESPAPPLSLRRRRRRQVQAFPRCTAGTHSRLHRPQPPQALPLRLTRPSVRRGAPSRLQTVVGRRSAFFIPLSLQADSRRRLWFWPTVEYSVSIEYEPGAAQGN